MPFRAVDCKARLFASILRDAYPVMGGGGVARRVGTVGTADDDVNTYFLQVEQGTKSESICLRATSSQQLVVIRKGLVDKRLPCTSMKIIGH